MVVEITPPGISSLQWKFYIIWCVFNFAFIPIGKSSPREASLLTPFLRARL